MTEPSAVGRGFGGRALAFLETDNGQRIAICAFSILATLWMMAFSGDTLAFALGLPYMFFIPGFAVVRLFFWRGTSSEVRFVLSLGLSIVVIIFLGLVLVLTPIGLDSDTTRLSLIVFTLGAVAADTFVPRKAAKAEEKQREAAPSPKQRTDKVVAAMLATALVVSGISLGLVLTADSPSRTYFALTDEDGMVIDNTSKQLNSTFTVRIEMKNGEDGPRSFALVAYGTGQLRDYEPQTLTKVLTEGETWNQTLSFELDTLGYFRLDFDLYIQEDLEPPYLYGNLHVWFVVYDPSQTH